MVVYVENWRHANHTGPRPLEGAVQLDAPGMWIWSQNGLDLVCGWYDQIPGVINNGQQVPSVPADAAVPTGW